MFRKLVCGLVLVGANAGIPIDVPFYCRLLNYAVSKVEEFLPKLEEQVVSLSTAVPQPFGQSAVTVSRTTIDRAKLGKCRALATIEGRVLMQIEDMTLTVSNMDWSIKPQRESLADTGKAHGEVVISFTLFLELMRYTHKISDLKLETLRLDIGSAAHPTASKIAETLVSALRPAIAKAIEPTATTYMSDGITNLYRAGGCIFLSTMYLDHRPELLENLVDTTFKTPVPAIGEVEIDFKITQLTPPRLFNCHKIGWNGREVNIDISDVQWDMGFGLSYHSTQHGLVSNSGTGSVNVDASLKLKIDFVLPKKSLVEATIKGLVPSNIHQSNPVGALTPLTNVVGVALKFEYFRTYLQSLVSSTLLDQINGCISSPTCLQVGMHSALSQSDELYHPSNTSEAIMLV